MRESGEENNWKLSDCSHPLFTSFSKFYWSPMGRAAMPVPPRSVNTHTHTYGRTTVAVFIGKYSTRHERTNLRFHRISSLIDSYIRRACLHARTNRVVPFPFLLLKFNEMVASWPNCFCFLFTYRGQPEFFLYGGKTSKRSFFLYQTDKSRFGTLSCDQMEHSKIPFIRYSFCLCASNKYFSMFRSNFNIATRDNKLCV